MGIRKNKKWISQQIRVWKVIPVMLCILLLNGNSQGQDMQFSQFYANSLYLNPALAGSAHGLRGIAHQRIQWPALDAKYITSVLSADYYFQKSKGGLGILFLKDWQGSNTISSTEFALQYSQEISLSNRFSARVGIQGSYVKRYINYAVLTFPDQYNDNGFLNVTTGENFGSNKIGYFDVSAGGMLYSDNFWVGIATHHINTPDQSFYGTVSNLPMKTSFITGYKILLSKRTRMVRGEKQDNNFYVTPTLHYKLQGKSDQVDLGIYGLNGQWIVGGWYRGIPFLKHYRRGLQNNESIVLLTGWKINSFSISYSFDFTVSKLTIARTGGSHEVNITYVMRKPMKRKKPYRKIPCPDFNK